MFRTSLITSWYNSIMQPLRILSPTVCLPIRKGMWMPSPPWKRGLRISPRYHSRGRLCFKPWSKRATLTLEACGPQDLIGEFTHSVIVKTVMPCLIIKCFKNKCRVYPSAVSSGLKKKLCEEAIVWLPIYVLYLPSRNPIAMLYQLGQGKIRTNIYWNALARLL